MSASPNIFWKTSHHFAVKRQYIIFVKQMHDIAVGDASFYQIILDYIFMIYNQKKAFFPGRMWIFYSPQSSKSIFEK